MPALLRKIRTFTRLEPIQRRQAFATIFTMLGIRLALWTLPFRFVKEFAGRSPSPLLPFAGASADQVAAAVCLASRYVPKATCLTQALTGQILLNRAGVKHQLHIGVAARAGFEAHAWIECCGRVLIGGNERYGSYTSILVIEGLTES